MMAMSLAGFLMTLSKGIGFQYTTITLPAQNTPLITWCYSVMIVEGSAIIFTQPVRVNYPAMECRE